MTLPTSGEIGTDDVNIELQRASTAPFSINGGVERNLAKKPSGEITMADFYGKSSVIQKTISDSGTNINAILYFTAEEWSSPTQKSLTIQSGVILGSTNPAVAALIINGNMGGNLAVYNYGSIQGAAGGPGAAGGDAMQVSTMGVTVYNYGEIFGGGGGGGAGGSGGAGGNTTCTSCNNVNGTIYCRSANVPGGPGGPGGLGGVGRGYNVMNSSGTPGGSGTGGGYSCSGDYTSGSGNKFIGGIGGTGGTGGWWGSAGAIGSTGETGQNGFNGSTGSVGGAAGRAIRISQNGSLNLAVIGSIAGTYW